MSALNNTIVPTPAPLAPGAMHMQLSDVLNTIDISGFAATNSGLFTALLTLNLLWSAIFIGAFYMLLDLALYYLPILHRVPLLCSFKNLLWFVCNLLSAVAIYASGTLLVVKIFGSVILLLAFSGLVKCFYNVIAIAMLYYRHRDFAVAAHGPNAVKINGQTLSLDHTPLAVTISKINGQLFCNGTGVPGTSLADCDVTVYTLNESMKCQPASINRLSKGQFVTVNYKSISETISVQTFYPVHMEQKTV